MRAWLGALGVLALLAGCDRRHDREVSRSGIDTIIRSSTVKDTTIVHADTSVDVDTLRKTSHIAAGAEDSGGRATLDWVRQPPGLPSGGRLAVVRGDPSKAGPFTIRVDLPDGYQVPPHWHPTDEHLTILTGTFRLGMGERGDESSTTPLGPGAYAFVAAKMAHYAWADDGTTIQAHGIGPFVINYVNPADDPAKAVKK